MLKAMWNGTVIAECAKTEIVEGNLCFRQRRRARNSSGRLIRKARDRRRHASQEDHPIDVRDRGLLCPSSRAAVMRLCAAFAVGR